MDAAAMKHMASNFAKLDKFKGNVESPKELWDSLEAKYMTEDASTKKFFKMNMDEAIQVICIIDKLPPSWKDFKYTLKHLKDELILVELGSYLHIEESLRMQDSDKPKGNNVVGPSVVNMVEHKNSSRYNDNKGKRKHHDNTKADPNKKSKDDDVAWWVNSGATVHVCKHRCWFKTYESLNDGSILHIGNESTALVHRHGFVDLKFSFGKIVSLFNVLHVPNIRKNLVSSSVLNNYGYKQVIESKNLFYLNMTILWHARLGHVHFKRMQDMSKDDLIPAFDMDTEKFVRLPDPKLKTLGEKGIECIFVGYAKHSKTFRLYVIEKEAINDEMDSIMGNNTWVLANIPLGCKPLGCKWIFKRKLKVDGYIEQFKARLVIQGFKQKSEIDYFDTYAPVARISTIRLLITMASIDNLIIHQMDMKTAFLNDDLDEERAPKQWHQKFDEVVLYNGYLLNQAMKSKFVALAAAGKEAK
uniref:Zinc finger, CCHC-type n=1 Tax=Tanacetum cinerariifolium TaxID=118510 RepID=A0A6L2LED0_TANCI|nr:zinc finger, CCHC-type [Tanacetum cinerariifolium]